MNADDIKLGKYLCHYGVKGMHWGEWNDETARRYGRVTKGSKFASEDKDAYKISRGVINKVESNWTQTSDGWKFYNHIVNTIEDPYYTGVSLNQWNGMQKQVGEDLKEALNGLRMKPESIEEASKKVNHLYGAPGYSDNCMGCAISTILRAKGFDVEADSSLTDDTDKWGNARESKTMSETAYVHSIFNNRRTEYWDDASTIVNQSLNNPDAAEKFGEYGLFRGGYRGGGGHIMTYTRDKDGNITVHDGQTSEDHPMSDYIGRYGARSIFTMRMDNLTEDDINYDALANWSGIRPREDSGYDYFKR